MILQFPGGVNMSNTHFSQELLDSINACFLDPEILQRDFYTEFRQSWHAIFKNAMHSEADYFDISDDRCYTVHCDCAGVSCDFHFDQLKIADWYGKELKKRKKVVFAGKKLKRSRRTGQLMYEDVLCHYEPEAEEPALNEQNRNIVACAIPGMAPTVHIVYGNKFV